MRESIISGLLIFMAVINAQAAQQPNPRGGQAGNVAPEVSTTRSARNARSATSPSRSAVTARSATTTKNVAARAATTTQKVINSGTKIPTATKNTAVNEACQNKYYGCMDAFCMLDNTNGGRCMCSNRNAELDEILAEIEKLDQQSYQMATYGVEKIEMGTDAEEAIARAKSIADETADSINQSGRKSLDLSLWEKPMSFDDEDAFDIFETSESTLDGKTGDALQRAASDLCVAQIPECGAEISMLKLLYAQKIKSDCNAYENSLKQQKNASRTKLATAERALRDASLEQLRNANKYDLGQCTIEFKKCMQTTGGCGEDFSACASVAAFDNTNVRKSTSKKAKNYFIKGAATTIEISASTYDTLLAKKPLCEGITKFCARAADQVWDTFLQDIAPTVKSAEIIAEDNARQSCIGNISSCFQKACRDNIDLNDPSGSYDMCLTRPETMLSVCRIPLNACGVDEKKPEDSQIWDFVVARLASMRVDSCTREVKECLQSEDRCGSDYTRCVGLDLASIISMCPADKLVGCQENGVKKSLSDISDLVMGIFLNIDNTMLDQCQKAVTTKMVELCGDTSSCQAFDDDDYIGTESLLSYKEANGNYVIDGLVSFDNIKINDTTASQNNTKLRKYEIDIEEYKDNLSDETSASAQRVISLLKSVSNKINQKIAILSQDSTIDMCINGRNMSQIRKNSNSDGDDITSPRFPNLLDSSVLAIINSGIERARDNYDKKYNQLVGEALEKQDDDVKSVLCAAMASGAPECVEWAESNGAAICTKYEAKIVDNVFQGVESSGWKDDSAYATRYIIAGADMDKLTKVQQSGYSTYIQTDAYGNMLGRISNTAIYSAPTNTCTLSTESIMCKNAESVITDNKTTDWTFNSGGVDVTLRRISGRGPTLGSRVVESQNYHGSSCTEFGEPVVYSTEINM